jgi:hypothetical protein
MNFPNIFASLSESERGEIRQTESIKRKRYKLSIIQEFWSLL